MCGSLFWGFLFITVGAIIIMNIILGLNIPIFKIFFAFLFIYWGISILMPSNQKSFNRSYFRCYSNYSDYSDMESISEKEKYKVGFSATTINLNHLASITSTKTIYISAQFSDLKVTLPEGLPVRVKVNSSFSTVVLPNGKNGAEYINLYGASEPVLTIYLDSLFSNVIVRDFI